MSTRGAYHYCPCNIPTTVTTINKMSAHHGRKSVNPMDKRVPENPKYKHVRPTVDTGASMSKYIQKVEELKRDYNFRKDEVFKRMKISTFVQLVLQVAEFNGQTETYDDLAYGDTSRSDRPDTADVEVARIQQGNPEASTTENNNNPANHSPEMDTSRSRLAQVINGMGEIDLDAPKAQAPAPVMDCPYLLLDVRDQDAFDEGHIITAKSYPTAMLARSVNYETKDMLKFKNQPGKIILVYDDEERISHRAATTLVQRGYDNLFMLSGGLKVAYKVFPEGLVTGVIPTSIWEEVHPPSKKNKEPQPKVPADIKNFNPDCTDKLGMLLDGAMTDRSVGSRLSKASTRVGRSTSLTSTTSSMSSLGKKPFK